VVSPVDDRTTPLSGTRVVDLTTFLSGPVAARTLADLGAEVVRVESPRGDPTRAGSGLHPGDPPSAFYLALHRDRQGVVLDLKTEAGGAVLRDLVAASDVLLENFSPGVTDRLGVTYEDLAPVNPRLVYCTITGFGPDGPYSQVSATDGALQAFGGVLELTGPRGSFGLPVPLPIADLIAGATAAQGVLAALLARARDGRGAHVDVSMLESLLGWLLVADRDRTLAPPTTLVLEAEDGESLLVQTTLHFQERFASLLAEVPGCESLADDPRFSTRESRQEHLDDYLTLVRRAVATRPGGEWLTLLASVGIPASRIQRIDDAVAHPQLTHRAGTVELDLPALGRQTVLTAPFRFDGQRKTTTTPPPTLGEHTGRVLRDVLGYDHDRIGALFAQGAFGDHEVA
jgi:crotonobetainyl-CoA:carnitine CoA-transferase CaiB-like acyl-CoA transferase